MMGRSCILKPFVVIGILLLITSATFSQGTEHRDRGQKPLTGRCNNGGSTDEPDPVAGCSKNGGLAYPLGEAAKRAEADKLKLTPTPTPTPQPTPAQKQSFIGDSNTKQAYPSTCPNLNTLKTQVALASAAEASQKGFVVLVHVCPDPQFADPGTETVGQPTKRAPKPANIPVARARTLLEVFSAPEEFAGKIITLHASIRLAGKSEYGDNVYSFFLEDDSTGTSLGAYMEKSVVGLFEF
jgi:hypothetical protein